MPNKAYSLNICTNYLLFYITAGQKGSFTNEEYELLTDYSDIKMMLYYRYLIYIIYSGIVPCTKEHYKTVRNMISYINSKNKNKVKEKTGKPLKK